MNTMALRQSPDFKQFMERVKELGAGASDIIKTETKLIKIGRAQGTLTTIDNVLDLLDQIEAEEKAGLSEEDPA